MPRMFDMLKGNDRDSGDGRNKKEKSSARGNLDKKKKKVPGEQPLNFPKAILKKEIKQTEKGEDYSLTSKKLISTVKKQGVDNQKAVDVVYEDIVATIKDLLIKIRNNEDLNLFMDKLYTLLDSVFNQLLLGNNLLNNVYKGEKEKDEYFLPYHITNLLILSLFLGISMGFNKSRLKCLGLGCIFCDTGLDSMKEIITQARKLTDEEYKIMKTHVSKNLKLIAKIGLVNKDVKEAIAMHHERVDGSGYPHGLKGDKINDYAKIIGLVDTYEAMTHHRPYHVGMDAHHMIRVLINYLKDGFDRDVIKLLINKMSIYPIGSIVKLDTEEVARIVSVKPGFPLQPVVMILKDAFGQPVIKKKVIIDLSKEGSPSVLSPV